jgi:hypothetical protein
MSIELARCECALGPVRAPWPLCPTTSKRIYRLKRDKNTQLEHRKMVYSIRRGSRGSRGHAKASERVKAARESFKKGQVVSVKES